MMPEEAVTRLGRALADRYRIGEMLGAGAAAAVFVAEDLKHAREVAVKVLRPELAATVGPERFLREIETAASLAHPHIVPLYNSGEADGFLYFVMPYIEGESLRERLAREGRLPLEVALRFACEVADALAYAHARGVVHRDVKPGNVLIESGHAVLVDFGIARAVSAAGDEKLTQTGGTVGTPAYMSPEQVAGKEEVDGRADLYSLGCLLFEMLTGAPPFKGPTLQAVLTGHLTLPPPAVEVGRSDAPAHVCQAVAKLLAKEPGDRFTDGLEVVAALASAAARTPPIAAGHSVGASPPAQPAASSIAVLPFTNLSPDPENEYFSDGITEEIINALAHIPDLRVAARTSAFSFKGKNEDLRTVGDKLNVGTVLEGSVRRAGNRLRITAQLVDVSNGYDLWSERYDRQMDDVFEVQDEIARSIAERLQVTLEGGPDAATLVRPQTENLEAYERYLKGRELVYQRHPAAIRSGIQHFREALDRDPTYALAHAGIAESYGLIGAYQFLPPREARRLAEEALQTGFDIAPDLAQLHFALGQLKIWLRRDWATGGADLQRAIELEPRTSLFHGYLAVWEGMSGRNQKVAEAAERAIELDPLSPSAYAYPGLAFNTSCAFDRAAEMFEAALGLDPNFVLALWGSAYSLLRLGRPDEAIERCERVVAMSQRASTFLGMLGQMYGASGRQEQAVALLDEVLAREEKEEYVPAAPRLLISVGIGEEGAIRDALLKNLEEETGPISYASTIRPDLDRLRSHPRLGELVDRVPIYEPGS